MERATDRRLFRRIRWRMECEEGFQRPAGAAAQTAQSLGEIRTGVAALERVHVCGLISTTNGHKFTRITADSSVTLSFHGAFNSCGFVLIRGSEKYES